MPDPCQHLASPDHSRPQSMRVHAHHTSLGGETHVGHARQGSREPETAIAFRHNPRPPVPALADANFIIHNYLRTTSGLFST